MSFSESVGPLDRIKKLKLVQRMLGDGKSTPGSKGPELVREVSDDDAESPGANFIERTAQKVAGKIYSATADDLEGRASRVVERVYENQADDLEDRAVRAMRRALADESDRIKAVIEHSVDVKKREVRLSLLVLIAAAAVYLLLEVFAHGGPAAG